MTKNEIDYLNFKENQRHNQVTEEETSKHNRADERIRNSSNFVQREGFLIKQGTDLASLNEQRRHNVFNENEAMRHNVAGERIDSERNLMSYRSAMTQANYNREVGLANVAASRYATAANYALGLGNLQNAQRQTALRANELVEQQRANRMHESQRDQELGITAGNYVANNVTRMIDAVIPF